MAVVRQPGPFPSRVVGTFRSGRRGKIHFGPRPKTRIISIKRRRLTRGSESVLGFSGSLVTVFVVIYRLGLVPGPAGFYESRVVPRTRRGMIYDLPGSARGPGRKLCRERRSVSAAFSLILSFPFFLFLVHSFCLCLFLFHSVLFSWEFTNCA